MRETLSIAIITLNEEHNLARTLDSVRWADEIVIVDAGSTDHTAEVAHQHGARFYTERWRGFAAQKNAAITKCTSTWVLSLDADEEVNPELAASIRTVLASDDNEKPSAYLLHRRNFFLGRWMRHGGYYPDPKLRLFRRGTAQFEERAVHETMQATGAVARLSGDLIHHAYPTLTGYLEHMNRYSTLGAEQLASQGNISRSLPAFLWNVLLNPAATFVYNYILRGGFLGGREGLLQHLYHSAYVSWKYAKAWESSSKLEPTQLR